MERVDIFFIHRKKKSPPQISLVNTLMLAGPQVGDHFTLNLYNKVIPLLKLGFSSKFHYGYFF